MRPFIAGLAICLLAASVAAQEAIPLLPDLSRTPGAINPALTEEVVCNANFTTKAFRKASKSERRCVLDRYGGKPSYAFTYDHIIPLELGGADSCDNLWPQARAEARKKDQIEDALRRYVCVCHQLKLSEAQERIRQEWRSTWAQYGTTGAPKCPVNVAPAQ